MLVKRFLGLATALVVFSACAETPTQPQPLDSELLTFAADPGNGAIVSHFSNDALLLLTLDFESGLLSVHYADSDNLPGFLSCVPEFHGAMKSSTVRTPNGKDHNVDSGEVFVFVSSLEADICDQPLAQGTIRLQVAVTRGPPGQTVASFSSNGFITDNSDGSEVRLHHVRKGVSGPPVGTVQLR